MQVLEHLQIHLQAYVWKHVLLMLTGFPFGGGYYVLLGTFLQLLLTLETNVLDNSS